jgi:hypothetical protein
LPISLFTDSGYSEFGIKAMRGVVHSRGICRRMTGPVACFRFVIELMTTDNPLVAGETS